MTHLAHTLKCLNNTKKSLVDFRVQLQFIDGLIQIEVCSRALWDYYIRRQGLRKLSWFPDNPLQVLTSLCILAVH